MPSYYHCFICFLIAMNNKFSPSINNEVYHWDSALARLNGELDILKMLIRLFLNDKDDYIMRIKLALEQQDAAVLQRELHTLGSVCATIGAETIEKTIRTLEIFAKQHDLKTCTLLFPQLEKQLLQLFDILHQKIDPH
jgi:HPt (histidine-containing phosphotransfer) domain-containing protein